MIDSTIKLFVKESWFLVVNPYWDYAEGKNLQRGQFFFLSESSINTTTV